MMNFEGEASIFHVALDQMSDSSKSTLTIEQVTSTTELNTCKQIKEKSDRKTSEEKKEPDKSGLKVLKNNKQDNNNCSPQDNNYNNLELDNRAATFLDVAVVRCLFVSQWQEEGIFWALQFLYNRYCI